MRGASLALDRRRGARGVTLVELMVALVISFILIAAAAYLYLSTRESQRGIDSTANANEVGQFAMQTMGRELMSAGFFPAHWLQGNPLVFINYGEYIGKVPNSDILAYKTGIYGCKNRRFDPARGTCENHTSTSKGDTLVLSYFTLDPKGKGQRTDCQGNDASRDEVRNASTRIWGDTGVGGDNDTPRAPLMVINAYRLNATEVEVEGRKSTEWSLSCYGNGASGAAYQPLLAGVEDIRFSYGLRPAAGTVLTPATYVDADNVGTDPKDWQRVVAVRVCVLVKSIDAAGTKLRNETGGGRSYVGCDGQTVAQADGDSAVYKTFTQTFGVRNRQGGTY